MAQVSITVNGKVRKANVEPRVLLAHFLRDQLNLTGTHIGCDTSQCGACTVLVDGRSVKSCTMFAVQADGSQVTTIEGLARDVGPDRMSAGREREGPGQGPDGNGPRGAASLGPRRLSCRLPSRSSGPSRPISRCPSVRSVSATCSFLSFPFAFAAKPRLGFAVT